MRDIITTKATHTTPHQIMRKAPPRTRKIRPTTAFTLMLAIICVVSLLTIIPLHLQVADSETTSYTEAALLMGRLTPLELHTEQKNSKPGNTNNETRVAVDSSIGGGNDASSLRRKRTPSEDHTKDHATNKNRNKNTILATPSNKQLSSNINTTCPDGQFYVPYPPNLPPGYNNNNKESKSHQRIPLIIHQTSKSRCLHNFFQDGIQQWHTILTNNGGNARHKLYHIFHDDAEMNDVLYNPTTQKQFPYLKEALTCLEKSSMPVMKADIWRLLQVYHYGGVYTDLDTIPGKNFTDTGASMIGVEDDAVFELDWSTGAWVVHVS